ncbi:MAG: cyclase [Candidatus Rokuibacteriota bacterium]|nr:MAG: cyclase [Candidatus Rokubacteria bacterium]
MSDKPIDEKWAPSKWGATDRAGSANHTKNSANIARALATIKQNKSITIGKYYHREAPAFGARGWNMSIPGTPTGGPFGKNALIYHDELVTTEIGQIQTQSRLRLSARGARRGRLQEKSKGLIPANATMLPIPNKPGDPGIVTADDVKGIMQMQGLLEIAPGDCVALHTGQGNSWSNDRYKTMKPEERQAARDLFNQGEPGFGISACEYMASRDIALTMCDTSACDAQPSGEQGPDFSVPCHTEMQTRRGIWNLENVDTKSLVDAKVMEGAFIWAPLRIIGATGSPGNPMVLY